MVKGREHLTSGSREPKNVFLASSSVQSLSSCLTLCNSMGCSTPSFLVHHQLLELAQTHVHRSDMPSNHLILCCPLFLLPPVPPRIRVFSNEQTLHMKWPKYWNFSFSIIPSKEHPGLIFRMDWLDLPLLSNFICFHLLVDMKCM